MDIENLKRCAFDAIDVNRQNILDLGHDIYAHPETGYREVRTTNLVADALETLGFDVERNIAVTGCRARSSHKTGPCLAMLGELDSVICHEHPDCNPSTGAIHACGHNIQIAVMYAVACALKKSEILDELGGSVDFIAVPAEEYIELDYRKRLKNEGKIHYYSGKAEFTYRGVFDDVNMCLLIHNWPFDGKDKTACQNTGTGFIGKRVSYIGKQAHAGAAPWDGVNALNMAMVAINSMNTQRETFKDTDSVRVHQIITHGGDLLNSVPALVEAEVCVRAMNIPALLAANEKINRCIHGAAIAMGGHAKVEDSPGQMPLKSCDAMADIFGANAGSFYKREEIVPCQLVTASFDMGDLSMFMPVLHSLSSGIVGGLHSKDYRVVDEKDAFIIPAKIMTATIIDLLYGNAEKAKQIIADSKPAMTRDEYLKLFERLENVIQY